jgi:hypothetical protein
MTRAIVILSNIKQQDFADRPLDVPLMMNTGTSVLTNHHELANLKKVSTLCCQEAMP